MPRGGFGAALTIFVGLTGFLVIAAGLWRRDGREEDLGDDTGDGEPVRRAWRARQVPSRPLPGRDGDAEDFSTGFEGSR